MEALKLVCHLTVPAVHFFKFIIALTKSWVVTLTFDFVDRNDFFGVFITFDFYVLDIIILYLSSRLVISLSAFRMECFYV